MATLDDLRREYLDSQIEGDLRFEWVALGGENKPLYQGVAPKGSNSADRVWRIQKFNYVLGPTGVGHVVVLVENRVGAWDNRATLF